jgi:myo-inositol 2-dehydrogenase / D-chiro-inositol 1-dehydrogenase
MSETKVKVALVGAGNWGWQHARIFAADPRVNFCAIAGRNLERTRSRAQEFGVRYYLDVEEMLAKEQPELVSLSLPNQGHYEATLQVIQAGFPLFVEKPLVFDLQEAETLLLEAEKRGLFFAINFNHRYAKPIQLASDAIRDGKLGDLVFATWRFGGEGPKGHPHANLIETQCHGFDMLEYLCGPIQSVMSEMTQKTSKGYTTMVLALQFENGAVGSLVGSYDSSYAYPRTHMLEINGTLGHIWIEDTVRKYVYHPLGSEIGKIWQAGYFNDFDREFHRTFDKHWNALLTAFLAGDPPPVHARAGWRALRLAMAAIESFETGKRITL